MLRRSSLKLNSKSARQQLERGRINVTGLSAADRQSLTKALKSSGSKFGNEITDYAGIKFKSRLEVDYYSDVLSVRLAAGEIGNLKFHTRHKLVLNGIKIGVYEDDFSFDDYTQGKKVIVDTKGAVTPLYAMKRALMKAIYGITITEIRKKVR